MKPRYLGLDLGTSSLKALLIDSTGGEVASAKAEYRSVIGENTSEQNPDDWIRALREVLSQLKEKCDLSSVESVSFSGQMHGLVCIDENYQVIRNAILWNDGRSMKESEEINRHFGEKALLAMTCNISYPGFWASKLLWMKKHEKGNFRRIAHLLFPKDYLAFIMSGVLASDVSDASGSLLYDPKSHSWSRSLPSYLGLSENVLPTVMKSTAVLGTLKASIAKESGLPATAKVVIGGGDQAVGAYATGTRGDNQMFISLGTSGVVYVSKSDCPRTTNGSFHVFEAADGGYLKMGVTLSAGGSLAWLMDQVLLDPSFSAMNDLGAFRNDDPLFLPYLAGERSPIKDPLAQGCFYGLSLSSDRKAMVRSVLEGVAFSLYDCFLSLKAKGVSRAIIIGGGANSDFWCQLISNIFGIVIQKPSVNRDPSFGAALLAAKGAGFEVGDLEKDKYLEYYPNKKERKLLLAQFRRYKNLYRLTQEME